MTLDDKPHLEAFAEQVLSKQLPLMAMMGIIEVIRLALRYYDHVGKDVTYVNSAIGADGFWIYSDFDNSQTADTTHRTYIRNGYSIHLGSLAAYGSVLG